MERKPGKDDEMTMNCMFFFLFSTRQLGNDASDMSMDIYPVNKYMSGIRVGHHSTHPDHQNLVPSYYFKLKGYRRAITPYYRF